MKQLYKYWDKKTLDNPYSFVAEENIYYMAEYYYRLLTKQEIQKYLDIVPDDFDMCAEQPNKESTKVTLPEPTKDNVNIEVGQIWEWVSPPESSRNLIGFKFKIVECVNGECIYNYIEINLNSCFKTEQFIKQNARLVSALNEETKTNNAQTEEDFIEAARRIDRPSIQKDPNLDDLIVPDKKVEKTLELKNNTITQKSQIILCKSAKDILSPWFDLPGESQE